MNTKVYPNVSGHGAVYTQHIPIYSFDYYDYQGHPSSSYGDIYEMFNALVVDICHAGGGFMPWM